MIIILVYYISNFLLSNMFEVIDIKLKKKNSLVERLGEVDDFDAISICLFVNSLLCRE